MDDAVDLLADPGRNTYILHGLRSRAQYEFYIVAGLGESHVTSLIRKREHTGEALM
jgi:hypothetical protein